MLVRSLSRRASLALVGPEARYFAAWDSIGISRKLFTTFS